MRKVVQFDEMLAVAERIADERGVSGLTVSEVAKQLGVRAPSLYHHIASHHALLAALGTRGCLDVTDALRRAVAGRSGADAIRRLCVAHRRYALAHPSLYEAAMRAPGPEDEALRAANRELRDLVVGVLEAAGLDEASARHGTRNLRSAVHGFISLELAGGFETDSDLDGDYERLISLLATGLLQASGARSAGGGSDAP